MLSGGDTGISTTLTDVTELFSGEDGLLTLHGARSPAVSTTHEPWICSS